MNKNKDIYFIILGVLMIVLALPTKANTKNYYTTSAEVVEARENNDCLLKDMQGNLWLYNDNSLMLYGRYTITLDNNNTPTDNTDDIIIDIK